MFKLFKLLISKENANKDAVNKSICYFVLSYFFKKMMELGLCVLLLNNRHKFDTLDTPGALLSLKLHSVFSPLFDPLDNLADDEDKGGDGDTDEDGDTEETAECHHDGVVNIHGLQLFLGMNIVAVNSGVVRGHHH